MEQSLREPLAVAEIVQRRDALLRRSEWVLIAYFANTAVLAVYRGLPLALQLAAVILPLALWWLGGLETRKGKPWSSVTRDWVPLGLVLMAYLQANWYSGQPNEHWQQTWVELDRSVLSGHGLHALVESAGAFLPSILEFSYLLMYAVPAICLGVLYRYGRQRRVDRFLHVFLSGTLCTYALLPHFPSVAPRLAFPGLDLPSMTVPLRTVNLWVLSHCDITTSVFPSGHVAAAFAAAFGMWRALPEKRWLGGGLALVQAILVLLATIYGRYHYMVDGLAGLAVSTLAFVAVEAMSTDG